MNEYRQLLTPYFDEIERVIGRFAQDVLDQDLQIDECVDHYLNTEPGRAFAASEVNALLAYSDAFWQQHGAMFARWARESPGLRARFSGDLGPQLHGTELIASAMYYDTVIVPDPLQTIRVLRAPNSLPLRTERLVLKHACTMHAHRDLYLADIDPPIVMLVPRDLRISRLRDETNELVESELTWLFGQIFDRPFASKDDVGTFLKTFPTSKDFAKAVVRSDLLLLTVEVPSDPMLQVEYAEQSFHRDFESVGEMPPTFLVEGLLQGRFLTGADLLMESAAMNAEILIGAPTPAHWLRVKVAADRAILGTEPNPGTLDKLALTNGLLADKNRWLGNMSVADLVQLRKRGALQDLRKLIARSPGSRLDILDPAALGQAENQIDKNLRDAFADHQQGINAVDASFRRDLGTSARSLLLPATVEVISTLGAINPELLPAALAASSIPSAQGFLAAFKRWTSGREALTESPIGKMMRLHREDRNAE